MRAVLETRLVRLKLQHFRCFEQLEISFHPTLSVIIGVNGAGKTAVLEGIAGLLQPLVSTIMGKEDEYFIEGFNSMDIKNGTIESTNQIKVRINDDFVLEWYASLSREGYEADYLSDQVELNQLSHAISRLKEGLKERIAVSLPVLAYYACQETGGDRQTPDEVTDTDLSNIFNIYLDALNRKSFDYDLFKDWFKWQELVARETGDRTLIETVKKAVLAIISDDYQSFHGLRTRYKDYPGGALVLENDGGEIFVDQLSSGERMLFGLVADLARRLAIANPQKENPLDGSGIVLIDEIDLHLHPKWQRLVLYKLRKTFKNIQFVVTTNSPQVLQYVKPENIMVIHDGKVMDQEYRTLSRDSNSILLEVFNLGMHSEEIPEIHEMRQKVRRCYDLIDDEQFDKAAKLLEELEDNLGFHDGDVVELRTLLELSTPTSE